jgi:hypothetical protein
VEEDLDEALLDAVAASEGESVRNELRAELSPYRWRMSEDVYESTLRRATLRRLRIRLNLPALVNADPETESPK